MYYLDTDSSDKPPLNAYSFLSTVKDSKSQFSLCEIEVADRDRDPKVNLGGLTYKTIKTYFQQRKH